LLFFAHLSHYVVHIDISLFILWLQLYGLKAAKVGQSVLILKHQHYRQVGEAMSIGVEGVEMVLLLERTI
jgi:hypothetical protein